ncbi:hypothetical protein CFP56_041021 [Quercus suber]|uniref:Uncharacterized protein n=1 Tax=Quercus suber TaxID=58331 RepID=A0AAW0LJB4_QUESU
MVSFIDVFGMAACLALEVINNAFVDLNLITNESVGASASTNLKASSEALLQPCHRKRKHGTSTAAPKIHAISPIAVKIAALEALEALLTVISKISLLMSLFIFLKLVNVNLPVAAPKIHAISPIAVKIAALEALEALLTVISKISLLMSLFIFLKLVGGALRSESWRSDVDPLLIKTATNSLKWGWASEEKNIFQQNEPTGIWVDFQLAALPALLSSLLSSVRVRPPYLSQGLELFRRAMGIVLFLIIDIIRLMIIAADSELINLRNGMSILSRTQPPTKLSVEPVSSRGATVPESIGASLGTQSASDHADNVFTSGQDVLVAKGDGFVNTNAAIAISEKITGDGLDFDGPEILWENSESDDE